MSRRFEKALEQATDQTLVEPFWEAILECVDLIRGGDVPVRVALSSIQKRIHNENPHVAHHSLLVLEACVKNCGKKFHAEIATKEFMDDMKNIVIEGAPDKVKTKVLELIQCWASAFEKYPQYKIVCDTHSFMKMYGFEFPAMKEADAMFRADSAPEWADGDSCFRCRVEFGMFTRKHHCRSCGQIFCDRCSNRQVLLPQFGIEKKVRVCESCFSKTAKEPTARAADTNGPTGQDAEAKAIAESKAAEEARQRALQEKEEEDLQLALAISQSEAEAKEKNRSRGLYDHLQRQEEAEEGGAGRSAAPPAFSVYEGVAAREDSQDKDLDPGLSRYLDKKYWEERCAAREASDVRATAPPPSELSFSVGSSAGNGVQNGNCATPALTLTPTQESSMNFVTQQLSSVSLRQLENDDVEHTAGFCNELKEQVEIMSNRIQSNLKRGRSIVNDSAIHSLFKQLTEKHAEVLGRISKLENEREYYESLQDQMAHIQEARQAVNALREEHERQRQVRIAEEQRQRQHQMQIKLDMMRHQKHEMLLQQRHETLKRFQEQEAQIHQRRLTAAQPPPPLNNYYAQQPVPPQGYFPGAQPAYAPNGHAPPPTAYPAQQMPPPAPTVSNPYYDAAAAYQQHQAFAQAPPAGGMAPPVAAVSSQHSYAAYAPPFPQPDPMHSAPAPQQPYYQHPVPAQEMHPPAMYQQDYSQGLPQMPPNFYYPYPGQSAPPQHPQNAQNVAPPNTSTAPPPPNPAQNPQPPADEAPLISFD